MNLNLFLLLVGAGDGGQGGQERRRDDDGGEERGGEVEVRKWCLFTKTMIRQRQKCKQDTNSKTQKGQDDNKHT